jgi:hypothetical protein
VTGRGRLVDPPRAFAPRLSEGGIVRCRLARLLAFGTGVLIVAMCLLFAWLQES